MFRNCRHALGIWQVPRGPFAPELVRKIRNVPLTSLPRFNSSSAAPAMESGEAPEKTTGEITKKQREFLVYYSNMFLPTSKSMRFIPEFLFRRSNDSIRKEIEDHLPRDLVKIKEFIPRENEGGVFVKFQVEDQNTAIKDASEQVLDMTSQERSHLGFKEKAHLVRGTPWIEDLHRTYTSQLRVEFDGPDLSPEQIYHEMRRYGRIVDIIPPSPSSKDLPRSAIVIYKRFSDASSARNCVNRLQVGETTIHVAFVPTSEENVFSKWIMAHPRISIPIIIALLAGLAYYIFEPIRMLSITSKARGYLDLRKYRTIQWVIDFYNGATGYFMTCQDSEKESSKAIVSWGQVYEVAEQVTEDLKEGSPTFNVIVGPKGSGKSHVVKIVQGMLDNTPTLTIDCQELAKAKTDRDYLEALAAQLGYHPAFLWTTSIARFVDLAATSLSGQSSGFSETKDQQTNRMLNTAAAAMQMLATSGKPHGESDLDYMSSHAEKRPVIIVKNYRGCEDKDFFANIVNWCASLVSSNAARVLVITQDAPSSYEKALGEVLPQSVLRVKTMVDANSSVAKTYILQSLQGIRDSQPDADNTHLDRSIQSIKSTSDQVLEPLGGRLSDLQNYTRRIVAGEHPCNAVKVMVDSSEMEIEQIFLNSKSSQYSGEQAWVLVRKLAQLPHNTTLSVPADLSNDPIFSGTDGVAALRYFEYRELILLASSGGQVNSIRAGKPLYHAAFQQMVRNRLTCTLMDLRVLNFRIKNETAKIKGLEDELSELAKMPIGWATRRQAYLSNKLQASQYKIEDWEKQAGELQKELKKIPH